MLAMLSRNKFTSLLIVMFLLNFTRMVTVDNGEDRLLVNVLGAAMLFAATLSLCVEKWSRTIALSLGPPAIFLTLIHHLLPAEWQSIVINSARVISLLFLIFLIGVVLNSLLSQSRVTRDSIAGALCGYALIGIGFAEIYCLLDSFAPHSYLVGDQSIAQFSDPVHRFLMLEYYSFTTLTTLGFGDILPVTPTARGLAIWEVTFGQFYLAVLVAGLVNLRGSGESDDSRKESR